MANINTIEKIMNLQLQEKNKVQQAYKRSVDHFEEKAAALYELLKKKEEAQTGYHSMLAYSAKISDIQQNYSYIESLSETISTLQKTVFLAREEMEKHQKKLTEAQVEVKKFGKIIEYKKQEVRQTAEKEEKKQMDEISIRQFMSYEKR